MLTATIDVAGLHPARHAFSLLGRIESRKLLWAGQFVCAVQTSVGKLQVRGNRDVLLDVEDGSWLALRLQRDEQGVRVSVFERASPLVQAAWLPSVPCVQLADLQRLRLLLGRLSPAAQALFMSVMASGRTQLRFFRRTAALDHHARPGGLFEQSVHAAELAYTAQHPSEAERDAATLAALLFDLGKLVDPQVGHDLLRAGPELEPHVMTCLRVLPACDLMERHDAVLASTVRGLLVPGSDEVDHSLYQRVRHAVERSWLASSFVQLDTK
ncbi:hypothetical protein [Methylibium sp.]|uniref:hypothetical protein n=1 Tax=Methylibium sp. TaxID=2067992 RepID=UPI0017D24064|nr:hypothetical protein [Methylibium sp.]MBA3591600.1 hypothetical protein [Methylibium sp.]